jgi:putative restriction endonuclease
MMRTSNPRRGWTRDELVVAFNLYCKIPFGRIHHRNPELIELAKIIGRTPSALAWKLANFARLDPSLRRRNIAGASHGARAEVDVWNEFNGDWERLSYESERLIERITGSTPSEVEDVMRLPEGKTRETLVRTRINQGFFRSAVLAAYGSRCCITGLAIPALLTASHIVPWSADIKNRTNPRNGLCLNALHDRAFDCGLLTVTPEFRVRVSARVKIKSSGDVANELLHRFNGIPIAQPEKFGPSLEFLRYHNERIFLGS